MITRTATITCNNCYILAQVICSQSGHIWPWYIGGCVVRAEWGKNQSGKNSGGTIPQKHNLSPCPFPHVYSSIILGIILYIIKQV